VPGRDLEAGLVVLPGEEDMIDYFLTSFMQGFSASFTIPYNSSIDLLEAYVPLIYLLTPLFLYSDSMAKIRRSVITLNFNYSDYQYVIMDSTLIMN